MGATDLQKVAMYLRKSRKDTEAEQHSEGETLSKHKKALSDLARKQRLNVVEIYEEVVSGERINTRPEMLRLLRAVENGEYDAVLCMDLDRLGRGDMIDQGMIINAFKDSNTLIVTPRKVYDLSSELDEEWSEFEAFIARRELKIITKRLQRGRIQSVQEGKYIGTYAPFGYDKTADKSLIPNQDAEIVRMIFNWYVNERMGSQRISNKLNEMGIKTALGNEWEASAVRALLSNEIYIGKIQWKKVFRNRYERYSYKRERSEWIEVDGKHEPIISKELFNQAQRIRKKNYVSPHSDKNKLSNPLAGIIVCSVCGRKMVMQPRADGKKPRIICYNYSGCSNRSSDYRFVEEKLLDALQKSLLDLELQQDKIREEIAVTQEEFIPDSIIINLNKELDDLELQKSRLHDLLEKGIYDVATFLERQKNINSRIEKTKKQILDVENQIAEEEERINRRDNIIPMIRSVLDAYHATDDIVKKNNLLKNIIDKAVYYKAPGARLDDFTLELDLLL